MQHSFVHFAESLSICTHFRNNYLNCYELAVDGSMSMCFLFLIGMHYPEKSKLDN